MDWLTINCKLHNSDIKHIRHNIVSASQIMLYACIGGYRYVCMYVWVYVCMYVWVYVCMYVYGTPIMAAFQNALIDQDCRIYIYST